MHLHVLKPSNKNKCVAVQWLRLSAVVGHGTASMNHQLICVMFVREMAGRLALLDPQSHYAALDIST